MANSRTNVNTARGRRMTKTALKRLHRILEPLTQLDFFVDREGVAYRALEQLRDADRRAAEAGIKLPLIRKRK